MSSDIRWGLPSDGHTFPIYEGPSNDLVKVAEFADERGVTNIRFGGDTWQLHGPDESNVSDSAAAADSAADGESRGGGVTKNGCTASATTQTGTWTVTGDGKSFGKSERYEVQADRHRVTIIAETKKNFVLDIDGEKAGQFTSENRGLRNLHVEFEGPGEKLPIDVRVFISWAARLCMETRMISSSWAVTIALLLCIPIVVLYWIGFV
ncbi:hypothetical protein ACN4EB_10380 [Corynebacterium macclintockiae]|uniref:Uncharacterized protein n=1 Tax=Corynebacterium macclintockiae TaxID=2913501 RepID=A0A9X3M925_9CORY|nr:MULTISPECIES: hypothetical protein [Corynebacterium]MCZ9305290.1 hypothetical protein [Corynebacterium macclintockiae]MDK8869598.1 hypothetical protein [Corynebacterium macclintockiae]